MGSSSLLRQVVMDTCYDGGWPPTNGSANKAGLTHDPPACRLSKAVASKQLSCKPSIQRMYVSGGQIMSRQKHPYYLTAGAAPAGSLSSTQGQSTTIRQIQTRLSKTTTLLKTTTTRNAVTLHQWRRFFIGPIKGSIHHNNTFPASTLQGPHPAATTS
jgi:hypothetical protein